MKQNVIVNFCKLFLSSIVFLSLIGAPVNSFSSNNDITEETAIPQQSFTEFKGIVIDSKTKEKLVFADITVNGTNLRTVTNKEGAFLLKVSNDLIDKTITVSYLGYNNQVIPLKHLTEKVNTIYLNTSVTNLSVVSISEPKDALALVKTAMNKKNENYHSNRLLMTSFYRETIKKGRRNASLSEAVLDVYKNPYKSSRSDVVSMIKSRKNTDYSKLDTIALKLIGGPYTTLHTDIVKYPEYIFNENTYDFYKFTLQPSTQVNGQQVYVVKFVQSERLDEPYYFGKLYINAETTTLVSAVFSLNLNNRNLASELFVKSKPNRVDVYPTEASYRVDYKTKNGTWYYGYSNIKLAFTVNWKKKIFNSHYTLDIEMAVTDWEIDNSTKVSGKNRLSKSTILVDEASGFADPEFWGEYNIIEPEKSIESAINKIAKQLKRSI